MDAADIALKVAVPVLGLVGGWVGAAVRIRTRLKGLEQKYSALRKGFMLEFDTHRDGIQDDLDRLSNELRAISDHLDKFRDSQVDFAREAALAQFIMQQQERWEAVQRTLGRIEGVLGRVGSVAPPRR
jgi:hypothetical protein